jgi:hypothetical protein
MQTTPPRRPAGMSRVGGPGLGSIQVAPLTTGDRGKSSELVYSTRNSYPPGLGGYHGCMPHAESSADLESSQVQRLEQWAAAGSTPQQVALRCRIVLLTNRGEPAAQIARRLEVQRPTVRLWRDRVAKEGIGAVWDIAPGRGRKPSYGKSRIARLVKSTLQDKPQGSTHWSTRVMAKA